MKDNKQSPLGLKILIEKHHHFIFKFLVALLQTSLAYWFSELQQLRHGCWSLKAPFPLSYLFPILRLHCFSSSSSSHCTFHCKTASPKPSTWAFYFPGLFCSLGFFFFFWALPSFLSDSYWKRLGLGTSQNCPCCLPARWDSSRFRDLAPRDKEETQLLSLLCHYMT